LDVPPPVPPPPEPPPPVPPGPVVGGESEESEVMTLVKVADVVVDVAVWLASSLANVAWAEAKLA